MLNRSADIEGRFHSCKTRVPHVRGFLDNNRCEVLFTGTTIYFVAYLMNLPNHHSLASDNPKVPGSKLGDTEGKESEIAVQKSVVFIAISEWELFVAMLSPRSIFLYLLVGCVLVCNFVIGYFIITSFVQKLCHTIFGNIQCLSSAAVTIFGNVQCLSFKPNITIYGYVQNITFPVMCSFTLSATYPSCGFHVHISSCTCVDLFRICAVFTCHTI